MSNYNIYNLWYNNIPKGWEDLDVKKELIFINRILKRDNNFLIPFDEYVFRSFHEIKPNDIKLVIIDEFPKNGIINGKSLDIGIPFIDQKGNDFNGKKLNKLFNINDNEPITNLFKSNIFLLHSSLTGHMENNKKHFYIWKDFLFKVFNFLNDLNPKLTYLVFGFKLYNENDFLGKSSKILQFKSMNDRLINEVFENNKLIQSIIS